VLRGLILWTHLGRLLGGLRVTLLLIPWLLPRPLLHSLAAGSRLLLLLLPPLLLPSALRRARSNPVQAKPRACRCVVPGRPAAALAARAAATADVPSPTPAQALVPGSSEPSAQSQ